MLFKIGTHDDDDAGDVGTEKVPSMPLIDILIFICYTRKDASEWV